MKKLVCVLAAAMLLSACGSAGQDAVAAGGTFQFHSPGGKTEIFYDEGERAPVSEIRGEGLTSDSVSLADYKDKIVVLNAWGQWCAPCRSESDDLQEVHEYLGDKGTVVGINVRDYSKNIAQDFVKDNGITYPSIYDPPFKTAAQLGGVPASVVPTTIVLDKQHRPAAVFLREVTAQDLIKVIDSLS
ncbi:thiol-disulfide isomerase/thioredoxin [Corynebacterium diphtheriae HC01]|uniref:TlpA family protein disulfide reductase n=1 Tax=Corynebacterium diphtheriae TaxID=1717 RepID=A0A811G1L9_CORDP|nr:TlpA disulfide reductase family protein [Corynebacterium diphtheriae]AEX43417.1 thiol-disulfide isomerase/thioredoxin [Corynebacterium diphtheriae 241]AEX73604.1 thiol-disulfide isomerase/thioredoxin [Corynebacterium diphtheriae HC01]APM36767.1 effector protein [Corynebacterium diphtheriae]AWR15095.1 thiol-disulfide isomerase/thioredoxin [Corynebacterium diphtheriae]MBG9227980.1 TlpA family protein disulfide reductase [Corynebacterium diphtheriae bv. gravis]